MEYYNLIFAVFHLWHLAITTLEILFFLNYNMCSISVKQYGCSFIGSERSELTQLLFFNT